MIGFTSSSHFDVLNDLTTDLCHLQYFKGGLVKHISVVEEGILLDDLDLIWVRGERRLEDGSSWSSGIDGGHSASHAFTTAIGGTGVETAAAEGRSTGLSRE